MFVHLVAERLRLTVSRIRYGVGARARQVGFYAYGACDSASQISAITDTCANRLGFRYTCWTAPLTGLSGMPVVDVKGRVDCKIQPRFAEEPILTCNA